MHCVSLGHVEKTYTYGGGIKHRTNSTNTTRNLFFPLVTPSTTPPHPLTFMLNSLPRRHTLKRSPTVSVAWLRMLFSNIALSSDT